jgi:hypothetical protein
MKLFTTRFIKDLLLIALFGATFYILTHNPITHPNLPVISGKWSIQLMQQPIILGIAGHNYVVLRDVHNVIVDELHGLATDATTGEWKTIGRDKTDKLKVFEFNSPRYNDPRYFVAQKKYAGILLYEGDESSVKEKWKMALSCKEEINALNLPYPPYGVAIGHETENSNSVAYTLTRCMNLDAEHLGLITPGWGKDLLGSQ